MQTLNILNEALNQKEQALIQYVKFMREAQDGKDAEIAALFSDLAKAEEKHIAVIRDQITNLSGNEPMLNKYQEINQYNSQHMEQLS